MKVHQFDKVFEISDEIMEIKKGAAALILKGGAYVGVRDYPKAEQSLLAALEYPITRGNYAAMLSSLALAQFCQEKYDDVLLLVDEAIKILPNSFNLRHFRAIELLRAGNHPGAMEAYNQAKKLAIATNTFHDYEKQFEKMFVHFQLDINQICHERVEVTGLKKLQF